MADKDFKVKTGLDLPAPLPASEGGTGQTSLSNAINALLPDQTNNASKILGTNGSSLAWTNPGAAYQTSAPSNPVTGQLWVDSDETGDSLDPYIIRRKTITATAGQTVFTTDVVFTDGYEQIYYNGVLLVRTTDYTTNGGTNTVTLLQGASAGDTVEIIASTPINLVNTLAGNSANTITAQTASSIPLTIEGASSQSASLFNIKNNAGETRYEFLANGQATFRATGPDQAGFRIERYTDDVAVLSLRGYGGTIGSPISKTNNGARIGMIAADGYDGTSTPSSARIQFFVDGEVSTGNVPGAIGFNTTPVGGTHTERMRITSAGNIGIGYAAPNTKLEIRSANAVNDSYGLVTIGSNNFGQDNGGSISFSGVTSSDNNQSNFVPYSNIFGRKENSTSGNYAGYIGFGTRIHTGALTERARINSTGYMLLGYTSSNGAYRLQVNSQIFATSSSIATSDGRYKENVLPITSGLDIINSLNPVSFNWKEHPVHNFVEGKTVGFIAQEVQEALSEYEWADNIIKSNYNEETEEEFLGIAEANIIPLLVSAVKELKAEFEEYKRLHP